MIVAAAITFHFHQWRSCADFFLFGLPLVFIDCANFCSSARVAKMGNLIFRIIAFFCFFIFWMYFRTDAPPETLYPPSDASFSARVCEVSKSSKGTVYGVLKVDELDNSFWVGRKIWFTFITPKYGEKCPVPNIKKGDEVSVSGVLRSVVAEPPKAWGFVKDSNSEKSFNRYLLNRFIFYKVFALGGDVKIVSPCNDDDFELGAQLARWINEKLSVFSFCFSENSPSAKILRAMILGDQPNLSAEQKQIYKRTGTMHLFAVSGFNIGIVAFAMYVVCIAFSIPFMWRPIVVLPILFLYVLACGLPPSAVRAFFMIAVFWVAYLFSRGSKPVNALMLSAIVSALVTPEVLYSAGFQLSYCVVGGLVLFSSGVYADFHRAFYLKCSDGSFFRLKDFLFSTIIGGLCVSIGASIVAMSISAYWFGMFSLSGILFSPLFVILATFAVICAMVSLALPSFLASFTNSCAAGFVWCMHELAEFVSQKCPMLWEISIANGYFCATIVSGIFLLFVLCENLNVWLRFSLITASVFGVMFLIWIF